MGEHVGDSVETVVEEQVEVSGSEGITVFGLFGLNDIKFDSGILKVHLVS